MGRAQTMGKVVVTKPRRCWQHPAASGCTHRMLQAGLKVQSPFYTLQRYVASGTGPTSEKTPGLPGCSQQKGWELG